MKRVLSIVFVLIFSGCTDDDAVSSSELQGTWIEIAASEKLIFEILDGKPYVTLHRGKEIRNGVLLPKPGSGPYEYELTHDGVISLRWLASSNSNYKQYPFKRSGNTFVIGNFFDNSPDNLTFIKAN